MPGHDTAVASASVAGAAAADVADADAGSLPGVAFPPDLSGGAADLPGAAGLSGTTIPSANGASPGANGASTSGERAGDPRDAEGPPGAGESYSGPFGPFSYGLSGAASPGGGHGWNGGHGGQGPNGAGPAEARQAPDGLPSAAPPHSVPDPAERVPESDHDTAGSTGRTWPTKGVARVAPQNLAMPDTEPVVAPPGEVAASEREFDPGARPGFDPEAQREFDPEPAPVDDGPRPGRSRHRSSRRRRQLPLWQEAPLLLLAAFCIAVLIRTFLLQAFYIPSESMVATLKVDDKVLVNKVVYDVRDPARGEVIVFRGTDRWAPEPDHAPVSDDLASKAGRVLADLVGISQPGEKDFIKRVIGLPGDTVACCDAQGRVTVNGVALDEPYIHQNSPLDIPANEQVCRSRQFDPVTVPKAHVFVMGDNRAVSLDSRCQGPVPIDNIIGRAFLVVWPTDRWHTLGPPDIFDDVPKPYAAPAAGVPYGDGSVAVVGGLTVPLLISFGRSRQIRARRPRKLAG